MRMEWEDWLADEKVIVWTKAGKRQKPSYDTLAQWVGRAWASVPKDVIVKGFRTCGWGADIPKEELHCPLRSLLAVAEAADSDAGNGDGDGDGETGRGENEVLALDEADIPGPSNAQEDPTTDANPIFDDY